MSPKTDAITTHTAALTKSVNSGTRHEASISLVEMESPAVEVVPVAFIQGQGLLVQALRRRRCRRRRWIGFSDAREHIGASGCRIFPGFHQQVHCVVNF